MYGVFWRCFLDASARDASLKRYAERDLTGFERNTLPSPDAAFTAALTGEPVPEPFVEDSSSGRPPGTGKLYPDPYAFAVLLGEGADAFYLKRRRWPTRQEAIK